MWCYLYHQLHHQLHLFTMNTYCYQRVGQLNACLSPLQAPLSTALLADEGVGRGSVEFCVFDRGRVCDYLAYPAGQSSSAISGRVLSWGSLAVEVRTPCVVTSAPASAPVSHTAAHKKFPHKHYTATTPVRNTNFKHLFNQYSDF